MELVKLTGAVVEEALGLTPVSETGEGEGLISAPYRFPTDRSYIEFFLGAIQLPNPLPHTLRGDMLPVDGEGEADDRYIATAVEEIMAVDNGHLGTAGERIWLHTGWTMRPRRPFICQVSLNPRFTASRPIITTPQPVTWHDTDKESLRHRRPPVHLELQTEILPPYRVSFEAQNTREIDTKSVDRENRTEPLYHFLASVANQRNSFESGDLPSEYLMRVHVYAP